MPSSTLPGCRIEFKGGAGNDSSRNDTIDKTFRCVSRDAVLQLEVLLMVFKSSCSCCDLFIFLVLDVEGGAMNEGSLKFFNESPLPLISDSTEVQSIKSVTRRILGQKYDFVDFKQVDKE